MFWPSYVWFPAKVHKEDWQKTSPIKTEHLSKEAGCLFPDFASWKHWSLTFKIAFTRIFCSASSQGWIDTILSRSTETARSWWGVSKVHRWCVSIVEKSTLPKALRFNAFSSPHHKTSPSPIRHSHCGHRPLGPCSLFTRVFFRVVFGVLRGLPLVTHITYPRNLYIAFLAMEESYISRNIYQTFCFSVDVSWP